MKAFLTDEGSNNTNTGLQVLGGSGFTTDWPLEQMVRDGRIARIYEGTNGIQAMDLVGRKLSLAGGRLINTLFELLDEYVQQHPHAPFSDPLKGSIAALKEATLWIATHGPQDPEQAAAAATPYLRLMALTVIAYLWSRMAMVAAESMASGVGNQAFLQGKQASAQYYFEKLLPENRWLLSDITSGKESVMALSGDQWAA